MAADVLLLNILWVASVAANILAAEIHPIRFMQLVWVPKTLEKLGMREGNFFILSDHWSCIKVAVTDRQLYFNLWETQKLLDCFCPIVFKRINGLLFIAFSSIANFIDGFLVQVILHL